MTAGFLVIAFVGALFPVVPSAFIFRAGWRRGGWARAGVVAFALLLAALALPAVVTVRSVAQLEDYAVMFFGWWFLLLLMFGTLALFAAALQALWRFIKPASTP